MFQVNHTSKKEGSRFSPVGWSVRACRCLSRGAPPWDVDPSPGATVRRVEGKREKSRHVRGGM